MRKLRLPPAAIAAVVFVACYAMVILAGVIAGATLRGPDSLALASLLAVLAVPVLSVVAIRRTRRRDDLSAKQKAILTGFLAGAAIGFPAACALCLSPTAALFLGLPTTLVGVPLDMALGAALGTSSPVPGLLVLRFLLLSPNILLALNCCLVGSLVGWIASAPPGGRPEHLRRVRLAAGLMLGPALAFCVGIGLTATYGSLQDWGQTWHLLATRQASNEASAIASLRTVVAAQENYIRFQEGRTYAWPFNRLYQDGGEMLNLIDRPLAESLRHARAGYHFFDVPFHAEGRPVDPKADFAVCAYPAEYGTSGSSTFFVTRDAVVWGKPLHGHPIIKLPRHPAVEGWLRIRGGE